MKSYYLDLSRISLREFFDTLTEDNLAPGRMILLEEQDARFLTLAAAGITTLHGLVSAVKTIRSAQRLADKTGISREYLTILRRQALSWLPKPVPLRRFAISTDLVDALAEIGINSGYDLYAVATALQGDTGSKVSRTTVEAIAHQASVPALAEDLAQLVAMVDLSRIPGVGPVFAAVFFDCGIDSCSTLSKQDPDPLHERVVASAAIVGYRGPTVTRWDIESCIQFAGRLTRG